MIVIKIPYDLTTKTIFEFLRNMYESKNNPVEFNREFSYDMVKTS